MNRQTLTTIALVFALALLPAARATETENLNMQILPAPGKVIIDGKFDDWDLTGGILACSDVENLRDQFSQWFHVMYDSQNLYVLSRWKDPTPLNNPGVKGDLRLSIGNFKGQPTAVVYRKVADEKKPKTFSSGVVKEYVMDSVAVLADAKISAKVEAQGKRYVVEAAIPLASLGLKLTDGLALRGDFGATHGDKSGADTALRTHWNNQTTGIVNDEVFELKMEPANWGEISFP